MADDDLLRRVHSLGDTELAVLLCLAAREHCLLSTTADRVDDLAEELALIARRTFGLAPVIVTCHARTTLDEFANALLLPPPPAPPPPPPPLPPLTPAPRAPPSPALTRRSVSPYRSSSARGAAAESSSAGGVGLGVGGVGLATGSYYLSQPGSSSSSSNNLGVRRTSPYSPLSPYRHHSHSHHGHHGHHNNHNNHNHNSHNNHHNHHHQKPAPSGPPQIANVIIAKNLDQAPDVVQIQALELLRTRRIFTRTAAVQAAAAPRQFLLAAVVGAPAGGAAHVTPHLNDALYVAHWHDPEEGFAHLEGFASTGGGNYSNNNDNDNEEEEAERGGEGGGGEEDDEAASTTSSESVVRRSASDPPAAATAAEQAPPLFADAEISRLAQLGQQAHVDVDVLRYGANVAAFLRMHRAVAGGVSPVASKHLEQLAKALAPLHGLDYVTPALVGLAARKIYLHRLRIVESPERERSVQWGSDVDAVAALLVGVGPEEVIDDVLSMVAVPS